MKIFYPCTCDDEEHEIEVFAEWGGYGIRARTGIYAPVVGEKLGCGRVLTGDDIDDIAQRVEESLYDDEP